MTSAVTEKTVTHLQLKSLALVLFEVGCVLIVIRVILPSLFDLDDAARTVFFSRATPVYVMTTFSMLASLKRLKEWSFSKTLFIAGICTTAGTFIMGLGMIIDL